MALAQWLEVLAQIYENGYSLTDNTPFDGACWDATRGRLQMYDFNTSLSKDQVKEHKKSLNPHFYYYTDYVKDLLLDSMHGWRNVLLALSRHQPNSLEIRNLQSLPSKDFSYSQAGLDEETTQMLDDIFRVTSVRDMANMVKKHSLYRWYISEMEKETSTS